MDLLVRTYLDTVYEHVCLVYPLAPAQESVDEIFAIAADGVDENLAGDLRLWLFRIARRVILARHSGAGWARANAQAAADAAQAVWRDTNDFHVWTETSILLSALASLSIPDQNILQLFASVDDLDDVGLAAILDVDLATARAERTRVEAAFREAYQARSLEGGAS